MQRIAHDLANDYRQSSKLPAKGETLVYVTRSSGINGPGVYISEDEDVIPCLILESSRKDDKRCIYNVTIKVKNEIINDCVCIYHGFASKICYQNNNKKIKIND